MLELLDRTGGPPESALRVPQVAHDEAVLPGTAGRSRTAQIRGWRRAVVHAAQPNNSHVSPTTKPQAQHLQMTHFMRRHDDAAEAA